VENPPLAIRAEPAAGDHRMNVGMQQQILSPGMEDGEGNRSRRPDAGGRGQ